MAGMAERQWPAEWMRGALEVCVLAVVARAETYGYEIAQRVQEAGLGTVKGGTLYPILTRLERDGLVASAWRAGDAGPGRKYFAITPAGAAALRERTADWLAFTERATALMTGVRP
jgi:PadR family transcriptional regulator PadR